VTPALADLDAAAIERALANVGTRLGRPLSVTAQTGSTSDDAKRAAGAGAPHGALFVADAQRSGRGRGANVWHSPPGRNVYLSLVLRPALSPASVAPITLAFGLAVASVVERRIRDRASIKWPNDVQVRGRKISGVLVEAQLRGAALTGMVVGVGLNVGIESFPRDLAARATSLAIEGARDLDRARIVAELVAELERAAATFADRGLAPFVGDLADRDALLGREVTVGSLRGVAEGIDDEGRLCLRDADRIHRVVAGEVIAL
jgi:BirA family biotin operon repressor/biotin-[acetyl-CoA-carboxylase] ligase